MNVRLDIFEGPLDLLLHLIKKNEVDIYDIPIAAITGQYVEYIEMMKEMNLDVAGEFILMAATLIHIKSKMLLPVDEEAQEEDEGPDPREELIRRLIEYKRYKDAAVELGGRLMLGRDTFIRSREVSFEGMEETGFVNVSVFDLIEAIKDIIARAPKERAIELTVERFRIADKISYVLLLLSGEKSLPFMELFPRNAAKGEIIVTFLAILELAKLVLIKIHQTDDGIIRVYSSGDKTTTAELGKLAANLDFSEYD